MEKAIPSGEPVLIVGAGPVGLSAALMLARHRVRLRIIDANEGPTDPPIGGSSHRQRRSPGDRFRGFARAVTVE